MADNKVDGKQDVVDRLIAEWSAECPELPLEHMAIVGRILILGRRLEKDINACLKEFDLQYSEFDVLATLRRSGAPYELTPTELMESVLLTSGAMTALLDRLTARKLIMRGRDKMDGRVKTAKLTKGGKKLIDKAAIVRFEEAQNAVKCFSKPQSRKLASQLSKMLDWFDEINL